MKVSPDQIDNCARRLDDAGVVWGQGAETLRGKAFNDAAFGSDNVGSALSGMYDPVAPQVLTYADETGFCVRETSTGLHEMATAYRDTEQSNTELAGKIQAILDQIGAG